MVMQEKHPFHVVDVFAEAPYQGNQLAVVLHADDLGSDTMQQIALEMNYAETTFVNSERPSDGSYAARVFTPAQELPFAGHPTLGTAWIIRRYLEADAPQTIILKLGVGTVPVIFRDPGNGQAVPWFTAPPVEFGPEIQREDIAGALNLSPDDIDAAAPVQELSVGVSVICAPLVSMDALRSAQLNLEAFAPLQGRGLPPFVYLFCKETLDARNDLCARFFFDALGVREDPATGSATACLGAYLVKHRYLASTELSLRVEQGKMVNRPSLLMLQTRETNGVVDVHVGGNVIETMQGELT